MTEAQELRLTYDPNTIEHLGFKTYSQIPNALAELIANAYDADATVVRLILNQKSSYRAAIEVFDNGCGMNFDDINNKFLRIGRNRRDENDQRISKELSRRVTGKKGLGKLALFGLANRVVFETKTKEMTESIEFTLDFNEFRDKTKSDYKPHYSFKQNPDFDSGTKIKLYDLTRKTDIQAEELAVSLSKLFQFFDKNFTCTITSEDGKKHEVNNSLRYASLLHNYKWELPDFMNNRYSDYAHKAKVTGILFTTEKPLRSLRGITLFSNGRMVKPASFFEKDSESNFFYSYVTGDINVDFIDEFEPDIIGTGRQDIVWSSPEASELRNYLWEILRAVENEWRVKVKESKRQKITSLLPDHSIGGVSFKLPETNEAIKEIFDEIIDSEDFSATNHASVIKKVQKFAKYAENQHKFLHPVIQKITKDKFENRDYYAAIVEAVKTYVNLVRSKSETISKSSDHSLMGEIFGYEKQYKVLSVTKKHHGFLVKELASTTLQQTIEDIENGHRELSQGIIRGARNPISHVTNRLMEDSGLFTEQDCLDLLFLISHLYRRVENSQLVTTA